MFRTYCTYLGRYSHQLRTVRRTDYSNACSPTNIFGALPESYSILSLCCAHTNLRDSSIILILHTLTSVPKMIHHHMSSRTHNDWPRSTSSAPYAGNPAATTTIATCHLFSQMYAKSDQTQNKTCVRAGRYLLLPCTTSQQLSLGPAVIVLPCLVRAKSTQHILFINI